MCSLPSNQNRKKTYFDKYQQTFIPTKNVQDKHSDIKS